MRHTLFAIGIEVPLALDVDFFIGDLVKDMLHLKRVWLAGRQPGACWMTFVITLSTRLPCFFVKVFHLNTISGGAPRTGSSDGGRLGSMRSLADFNSSDLSIIE